MSYETLEPKAAAERLESTEGAIYLDVRTPEEYAAGHAPGAYNIPYLLRGPAGAQPNGSFVDQVAKHFTPQTPLVLGCAAGMRSARACDLLVAAGFESLVNMDGGFSGRSDESGSTVVPGWAECGLPVVQTPESGRSFDDLR